MLPMIPKESGGIFDDGSSDSKFSCVLWFLTFILVVIIQKTGRLERKVTSEIGN